MSNLLSTYPVFESNQVLTSSQLNSLVNFLDQQNRLTRAKLIGMGIVCGLEISYDSSTHTLSISRGTGITSEGYLVNLGECPTVKYRPYTLPPGLIYEPFVDPNTQEQDIDLYELLTDEAPSGSDDKLLNDPSNFLDDMVVLLFVECFDKDLKSCLGTSCDELGKDRILTIRKLLISKNDLSTVWARTDTGKLDAIYSEKYDLPVISLSRPLFDPAQAHASDYVQFSLNYASRILTVYNNLFDALAQTYDIYRPLLLESYNEVNPFTTNPINTSKNTWREFVENTPPPGSPYLGIQYMYDFIQDLILAYDEFKEAAFELLSECCPDMSRFPKHLMIGEANSPPPGLCSESEFRHEFVQPPIYNDQKQLLQKTVALHNRIVLMLESFDLDRINAVSNNDIKITPSCEKKTSLSNRSISWYYDVDHTSSYSNLLKLEEYWNYEVSRRCVAEEDGLLLSYQKQLVDQSSIQNKLTTPLYYDLQNYSFLRIEGHIGKQYDDAEDKIRELRDKFNLPFDLITIRLNGSSDEDFYQKCNFHELEIDYLSCVEEIKCSVSKLIGYWSEDFGGIYGDGFALKFILESVSFQEQFTNFADALNALQESLKDNLYEFSQSNFLNDFITPYQNAINQGISLKNNLNNHLENVVRSVESKYPVELYVLLSQIYNEFFRLLDQFILTCWHRKLAVIYHYYVYLIEYLESHDNKIFAQFITEHRGIDHQAGVQPGGTFILLKNGIATVGVSEGQIIGDFMLPYAYCCDQSCAEIPIPETGDISIPDYTMPDYKRFHQGIYAFGKDILRDIKSKKDVPILTIDVVSEIYYDRENIDAKTVILQLVQNELIVSAGPLNNPGELLPSDISPSSNSIKTEHGIVIIAFVGDIMHFLYKPDPDFVGFDGFEYVFAFKGGAAGHSSMGKVNVYVGCCGEQAVEPPGCYNVEILNCWGVDYVKKALGDRGINYNADNMYDVLLNDLRRTKGFTIKEISSRVLENKEARRALLKCLKIPYDTNTDYETLGKLIINYQVRNCGFIRETPIRPTPPPSDPIVRPERPTPPTGTRIVRVDPAIIETRDLTRVLGSRGVDVPDPDNTTEVVNAILDSGGSEFTISEVGLLTENSIKTILKSKNIRYSSGDSKEILVNKLFEG